MVQGGGRVDNNACRRPLPLELERERAGFCGGLHRARVETGSVWRVLASFSNQRAQTNEDDRHHNARSKEPKRRSWQDPLAAARPLLHDCCHKPMWP